MSSQRFNNELRKEQSDPDFDLDAYLLEQSEPEQENVNEAINTPKSSFFKNAALILSLSAFALLYFNDWSAKKVYGNIFGVEEFQSQTIAPPVQVPPVTPITSSNGGEVIVLDADELQGTVAGFEGLRELEQLAALEALEGLGELAELSELSELSNLEGLVELENLAKLSALGALANLDNARVINTERSDGEFPSSLESYTSELSEAGFANSFDQETVKELYDAGVPVSVLKALNDNNLLETVGTSSLIEGYKNKDN